MCVESTQRQAAQISPPSCICSSGSVSFTSCFPHTNASFSLTDSPQQMHRIQFQPQKLNFFFCSLGGSGGGVYAIYFWRGVTSLESSLKKKTWEIHAWGDFIPSHLNQAEPPWNATCAISKQNVVPLQLEENKPARLWTEDDEGAQGGCRSLATPNLFVPASSGPTYRWERPGPSIPSAPAPDTDRWPGPLSGAGQVTGPINKQIARLRSFVCHQHEVLFFIISEPQIINTHKPNDAWLLLQSLSH